MNPHPKPLNWVAGQVPKGGGWRRRQIESDAERHDVEYSNVTDLDMPAPQKKLDWPWHHNHDHPGLMYYELVCFTDDKEDKTLTQSCDFAPWIYGCDLDGNLTSLQERDDCQKQCRCVPDNPRPAVVNWPEGAVPRPGFWKRDAADAAVEGQDTISNEASEGTVLPAAGNGHSAASADAENELSVSETTRKLLPRHDWTVICHTNNAPSKQWTDLCTKEPWSYVCDEGGKMKSSKQFDRCDQL